MTDYRQNSIKMSVPEGYIFEDGIGCNDDWPILGPMSVVGKVLCCLINIALALCRLTMNIDERGGN